MKTIEFYEKTNTKKLQLLLKKYEPILNDIELNLEDNYDSDLKKLSEDYDIDIHLIRMELNKRLWYNDLKN